MKKLTLLLAFIPMLGFSQITQEIRKELDVRESSASNVIVVGDQGLVTYGYRNERGAPDVMEIVSYSTDFEQINSKEVEYPRKSNCIPVLSDEKDYIHFVFLTKKEIHTFAYSTKDYKITEKEVTLDKAFTSRSIKEMNGKLFFSGYVKKVPTIMIYDPFSGKQTYVTLPGINKKRTVESFNADNLKESMVFFYRDGKDIKHSNMYVFMLGTSGSMRTQPIELDKDPKYSIIDGKITWINNDEFVLAGTYGTGKMKLASGIYFSKWSGTTQTLITYHSFTDFENFFKYLPENKQKKIEKKKAKKESQGKEDYVRTWMAVHPVLDLKDSYMFIGEVYYPTYRTETTTSYVNGKATTTTRQVFDGYQYSHAVVLGLDQDGNKKYDHCFPMSLSDKPYSVILNLQVSTQNDITKLLYCTGSSIRAFFIDGDQMSDKDYGSITTEKEKEGDKVKWTGITKSAYWYDNYYIIYGTQMIKNKENEGNKKRTVFFLSKISYED